MAAQSSLQLESDVNIIDSRQGNDLLGGNKTLSPL